MNVIDESVHDIGSIGGHIIGDIGRVGQEAASDVQSMSSYSVGLLILFVIVLGYFYFSMSKLTDQEERIARFMENAGVPRPDKGKPVLLVGVFVLAFILAYQLLARYKPGVIMVRGEICNMRLIILSLVLSMLLTGVAYMC